MGFALCLCFALFNIRCTRAGLESSLRDIIIKYCDKATLFYFIRIKIWLSFGHLASGRVRTPESGIEVVFLKNRVANVAIQII